MLTKPTNVKQFVILIQLFRAKKAYIYFVFGVIYALFAQNPSFVVLWGIQLSSSQGDMVDYKELLLVGQNWCFWN